MLLADQPTDLKRIALENHFRDLQFTPKLGQRLLTEAYLGGKTNLGYFTPPQDGKSYAIAKLLGAFWVFPDTHLWIVGPTYEDGSKEFGYLYEDWARLGLLRTAKTKHHDVRGGNMRVELKNGTWVQVITAKDQENLRRDQLDLVVYAEASKLPENLHERYVYSRVEKRRGATFYPTTHKGFGWVWSDVLCKASPVLQGTFRWGPWLAERRDRVGGEVNPAYDPDYWACQVSYVPEFGDVLHAGEYTPDQIAKARRRLLPQHFAEQFGGEAASYAGLVYPFSPLTHECEPFRIPDGWQHVVGYDHGAGGSSDPTAILVGSYAPNGVLHWWGEIYDQTTSTIQSRGSRLQVLLGHKRPAYIMTGRDSKQVITELRQIGQSASTPPDWSVEARIIRMTELMGLGQWVIHKGKCPNLRREIGQYEWDDKRPGVPRDGNDHCLEAAGYASLAPVILPDAAEVALPETPGALADQLRQERVWGGYQREQRARERRGEAARIEHLLEPDFLESGVVGEYVAR